MAPAVRRGGKGTLSVWGHGCSRGPPWDPLAGCLHCRGRGVEGSVPAHCAHWAAARGFGGWICPWEGVQDHPPDPATAQTPSGAWTPKISLAFAAAASPFHGERPPASSPPPSRALTTLTCSSLQLRGLSAAAPAHPCSPQPCLGSAQRCLQAPQAAWGLPKCLVSSGGGRKAKGDLSAKPQQSFSVSPSKPPALPVPPELGEWAGYPALPLPALMVAGRAVLPLSCPAPLTAQGWMEQPP